MIDERKVPEIRFKGFDGEWEERRLFQVVDLRSGRDYKHLSEGNIPVYGTGGYLLSVNDALSHDEDAIGIGRKGTIDKTSLLKAPFWTVDTLFYAVPKEKHNLHFIFDIFQTIDWKQKDESTGVPSLSKVAINETYFHIPQNEEQSQIGTFFQNLDSLITLHQRKYEKLTTVKKAMLEKMFPKDGADVPEIRFKGFTEKWERRKLGTIYSKIRNAFVGTATPYYVKDGYFYLESNNVKNGMINRNTEIFINDEFYQRQKDNWLRAGDLVMVQSGHVGHSAVIPPSLDKSAAHALIFFTDLKYDVNPHFINYQLQTTSAVGEIEKITTGNTIKHILSSDMKDFFVSITILEEQSLIASYFIELDSLITLQQCKLDKLKNIKKACLEKMFV